MPRIPNLRYLGKERPLGEARSLFHAARSAECLAALGTNGAPEAVLLRARSFLRLGERERAGETLERVRIADEPDYIKAEHHALRATVFQRRGEIDKARRFFDAAKVVAKGLGGAALAEVLFFLALAAWADRDLARAEALAAEALAVPPALHDPYARALATVRAQALELHSLVAAGGADFEMQALLLASAWRESDESSEPDQYVRANLLKNLAPLVWELHLVDEAEFLETACRRMPWTDETAVARWAAERALAWHAALDGDHLGAFRRFRECIDLAPSVPMRIASTLDRAYLAAEMRERVIHAEEMGRVYDLAARVDWEAVRGDDGTIILRIAEAYAREDGDVARVWLGRYDRARIFPRELHLLASDDPRQSAWEWDAEAAVFVAEKRPDRAVAMRRLALETWDAFGHRWRAARTAIAIAEVTGAPDDVVGARQRTDEFRRSWLGRRLRRLAGRSM
jgi:tetratricopeptide (TPR) repeat protein